MITAGPIALRRAWPAGVVAVLTLLALAAGATYVSLRSERAAADAQLHSVVRLQQAQVGGWLRERMGTAGFLSTSTLYGQLYVAWRDRGDTVSLLRLLSRMSALRRAGAGDGAATLVLDDQAQAVARDLGSDLQVAPELVAAAR